MPPTSKNLEGHIALGLSVRSSVRQYAFGISHIFGTMHARILKFNKCIAYEKLVDLYFCPYVRFFIVELCPFSVILVNNIL